MMKEIWNLPYLRLSKLSVGGLATAAALFGATLGAVPASAKSLVIARDMDMNSLDLHRAWCESCIIYNNAVYEGLPDSRRKQ